MFRTTIVVLLLLCSAPNAGADSSKSELDPSGHWIGKIVTPQREIAVAVDLQRKADGSLVGAFDNIGERVKGFPLSNVTLDGNAISFEIRAAGGGTFRGTLAGDGQSIAGDFVAQEMKLPFSLARNGDAVLAEVVPNPRIAKELEGTWSGLADDTHGKQLEVRIRLTNRAETAEGFVITPEGAEIPITRIAQKGADVVLELRSIGGAFELALNGDATELAGTWSQAEVVVPLTLRRVTGS